MVFLNNTFLAYFVARTTWAECQLVPKSPPFLFLHLEKTKMPNINAHLATGLIRKSRKTARIIQKIMISNKPEIKILILSSELTFETCVFIRHSIKNTLHSVKIGISNIDIVATYWKTRLAKQDEQ